jgi:quinol-cytochrome oxidoreductase complex cytochrome b subunit
VTDERRHLRDDRRQHPDDRRDVMGEKPEVTQPVTRDLLARMEVLAMLAASVGLMVLSLFRPAPLGEMPDPVTAPAHVSAPWIFAWIQELLRYLPAFVAGVIIPMAIFLLVVILPFIKIEITEEGTGTLGKRVLPFVLLMVSVLFIVVMTIIHFIR